MILQQPVERAQMQKLLATGRSDLFTRFISKKGRPFKAYLVKTPEGRVGFEFEARKAKAEKPAAPASASPKERARGASARSATSKRAKAVKATAQPATTVAKKAPAKSRSKAA
jgi:DNA topoisomerase-3